MPKQHTKSQFNYFNPLDFMPKEYVTSQLRICVLGVGGSGSNTIRRLTTLGAGGAELIAINTDRAHLQTVPDPARRILIGEGITRGLGAGGFPEVAAKAAEASADKIREAISGCDLAFLCAGMGGGTGTGASPIIADIARKEGALVVGFVTYPFRIERVRLERALHGIDELAKVCDTLIVIDNNRLLEFYPNLPIESAFVVADEVIARAVAGIATTLLQPSLINLDFADLRAILQGGGISAIAVGEGTGNARVEECVRSTLDHRLLDVDPRGATGVLLHLTGGADMTLGEANELGEKITSLCDPAANVIWGARMDPAYSGRIECIAVFSGLKEGPRILSTRAEKEWKVSSV